MAKSTSFEELLTKALGLSGTSKNATKEKNDKPITAKDACTEALAFLEDRPEYTKAVVLLLHETPEDYDICSLKSNNLCRTEVVALLEMTKLSIALDW